MVQNAAVLSNCKVINEETAVYKHFFFNTESKHLGHLGTGCYVTS